MSITSDVPFNEENAISKIKEVAFKKIQENSLINILSSLTYSYLIDDPLYQSFLKVITFIKI